MVQKGLQIDYFTDVLCIWAYGAQIRIDKLTSHFATQVTVRYRFISLFGSVEERIGRGWAERGGFEGFHRHSRAVAEQWDHVRVHERLWLQNRPPSSMLPHLFLKAVQCLEADRSHRSPAAGGEHSVFEEAVWRIRLAFFRDGENICNPSLYRRLAEELDFDYEAARALMDNGEACAALHQDELRRQAFQVPGSPTLVFNDGRQRLYGNVGYRIIEANVRELLRNPLHGEASWC